ncbi:hypothetical protein DC31_15335 [Microbacterium sp. CH12i]|uniref:hypothetical protein n=1 Tax=Microbacterium sp. CH12i TaxID=1479651 RepID=UPI000461B480|nr:hypothetical protein [Microbacterium sp. CH12i]KDA05769.1 hypothetical protein DC31_15335 [Microbacterium sp. CH12i]
MTSEADDALSWEGDDELPAQKAALPSGWNAVGKDSETVGLIASDGSVVDHAEPRGLSTPMLLLVGIVGGIYLLYTVGWIIGGLNLQGSAMFLIPGVMYQIALWAAVLAPALWFGAVWLLTRRSAGWMRVLGFLGGVLLLVPWPFVMTGVTGA